MLDVEGFRAAVAEAQRIVPGIDVQQKLATDPQMIFGWVLGAARAAPAFACVCPGFEPHLAGTGLAQGWHWLQGCQTSCCRQGGRATPQNLTGRLFGHLPIIHAWHSPRRRFQRGGQLIPYDEPRPLSAEEQQQEQDEYGAYYKW